jgi:hypothetical protein
MAQDTGKGPGWSREWRGTNQTWRRAYTQEYRFPVTTYKVGANGERIPVEAVNR